MDVPGQVLAAYGLQGQVLNCAAFGSGLINRTWKIDTPRLSYILQRVNEGVFADPAAIAFNIELIAQHLRTHHPAYFFVAPVQAHDLHTLVPVAGDGYYRLFPFVAGSRSIQVAGDQGEAREAAGQFGRFTRLLSGLDPRQLRITIPAFHDLALRQRQFTEATRTGHPGRLREAADLIRTLLQHASIPALYDRIRTHPDFRLRITHHDTKISNVLFDEAGRGLCVIDLDTVMPGFFLSDVGDMMRTYLPPVSEEEADFGQVTVRDAFYHAIVEGYTEEMKEELTLFEKEHFFYAGLFMIYMQAIRFLTDYLHNDPYYGARYPTQNLVRAGNQAALLRCLLDKEAHLTGQRRFGT